MKNKLINKINNINVKLSVAFIVILMLPAISIGTLSYTTAKDAVENTFIHGIGAKYKSSQCDH